MNPILAYLARGKTAAELADRPPNYHGSKMNQARRRNALDSWHNSRHRMFKLRSQGATQAQVDRAHFGPRWYDFAIGVKREEANAARVAKAQAVLRHNAHPGAIGPRRGARSGGTRETNKRKAIE